MNAVRLQSHVASGVNLAFVVAAEVVRAGTFYKTESSAGTGLLEVSALAAPVQAMVLKYHSGDIDGTVVQVGDEKLFIRASELSALPSPGVGDYVIEALSGLRREVMAARLDPTGSFWTMQTRRRDDSDWGDLGAVSLAEDWGDLSGATFFEDWQT